MAMTEKEKKKREALFKMMMEYPDLQVVPLVDSEIVSDDSFNWWIGSWGPCQMTKYLLTEERVFFDDDDPEDVLSEIKGWDWYENATDEEVEAEFKALPWIKAIAVRIELPEI